MSRTSSCGASFFRGVLLLLNILFILFGLTMIGLGIYIKVDKDLDSILGELANASTFEGQSLGFLAFVMIGGGVFTVLISLFGCFSAIRVSPCLLLTYSIILSILMVLEFVGFIMAFAYRSKLEEVYKDSLADAFGRALTENKTVVLNVFHKLEDRYDCCGIKGPSDYTDHHWIAPPYCYVPATNEGCSAKIIDILETNLPIVAGILGAVLTIELFILISTFSLRSLAMKDPYDTYSSNPAEVISNLVPGRRRNYNSYA